MDRNPSLFYLFHLFCCPPTISSITNKVSFLPPPPSYSIFQHSDDTYRVKFNFTKSISLDAFEKYVTPYIIDNNGKGVACLYLHPFQNPSYIILYSHGNALDIGQAMIFLMEIAFLVNCNIVSYDYCGYGASGGKPCEKNLKSTASKVYEFMINKLKILPEKIILYGQSIGSVPTIYLGSKFNVSGMIVQSGLASGLRMLFRDLKRTLFFDVYKNCELIKKVTCKSLIIHGFDDEVIPLGHGYLLYDNVQNKVQPLWAAGYGHNDIELSPEFIPTLRRFINNDLQRELCMDR